MIKHCIFWQHRFSVTYGGGLFVAVSYDGFPSQVQTSSDGLTWATQTSAVDNSWLSVTWGNNTFVAVASSGDGDRVMVSSPSMPPPFRTRSPSPAPTIAPTLSPTDWLAACDNAAEVVMGFNSYSLQYDGYTIPATCIENNIKSAGLKFDI